MISLKSEVFPEIFYKRVDYTEKTMFVGSCFAENIGEKLIEVKLPTLVNPFGVLYNPESVRQTIETIVNKECFNGDELVFFNEKWISFSHHGSFSGTDKNEVLTKINQSIDIANQFLKDVSVLFMTFGTAWVYRLKSTSEIVANCHKIPSKEFDHFLLEPAEIIKSFQAVIDKLKSFNPRLEIVLTVSPVRHWKDGPVNNQLSKSVLFVAIHKLVQENKNVHYFPSYELMMDDLRDYRFYANDLFHPNQLAVDYIWAKFLQTYVTDQAKDTIDEIEKLRKNIEHRVFYPNTEAYKKFIANNLGSIAKLKKEYPFLNFENEQNHFINEGKKYFSEEF